MNLRSERGDIIIGGLLRTVAALLLIALVVYELGAWGVNALQLDDLGDRAARAAASTVSQDGSAGAAEQAALDALQGHQGVRLRRFDITDGKVHVVLRRPTPLLVLDRVPPLREYFVATTTKAAGFLP